MRSTTAAQSSPARHTLHDALNAALDAALDLTVVGSFSRIGYAARRARFGWDRVAPQDLSGRVVVVTGATSGLGLAAARMVARRGADVFLVARDAARADAARRSIVADVPNAQIETIIADLADLDAVRAAATRIGAATERIDALINNAGALVHQLERTRDGIELTAQVHVVAPFLLTTMLLPRLHAAGTARVVTVSSGGMYLRPLDVDALDAPPMPFDGARAYANAKRAEVVLSEQWSRHAAGRGIHFHAMHPGWADTPGIRSALPRFHRLLRPLLRSADEGADTMAWLVGAREALESNGRFWLDRRPQPTSILPGTRPTPAAATRLWNWCIEKSGTAAAIGTMS